MEENGRGLLFRRLKGGTTLAGRLSHKRRRLEEPSFQPGLAHVSSCPVCRLSDLRKPRQEGQRRTIESSVVNTKKILLFYSILLFWHDQPARVPPASPS